MKERIHTGFYAEREIMSKEDGCEYGFDFMDNIRYENLCAEGIGHDGVKRGYLISASFFLHGDCDYFAKYLHERFGYPVYEIKDDNGNLVHCFGLIEKDGVNYYVDVRGMTTDYSEFLEEFLDFIEDEETAIQNTTPLDVTKVRTDENLNKFLKELFKDYRSEYVLQDSRVAEHIRDER